MKSVGPDWVFKFGANDTSVMYYTSTSKVQNIRLTAQLKNFLARFTKAVLKFLNG